MIRSLQIIQTREAVGYQTPNTIASPGKAVPLSVTGLEELIGGRLCMPSYQSLCFLSSSPQPMASSLATTLTKVLSAVGGCDRHGRRLTLRAFYSVPPLFLPGGDCAVSFPKQHIDRHTVVSSVVVSPSQSRDTNGGQNSNGGGPTCKRASKSSP